MLGRKHPPRPASPQATALEAVCPAHRACGLPSCLPLHVESPAAYSDACTEA